MSVTVAETTYYRRRRTTPPSTYSLLNVQHEYSSTVKLGNGNTTWIFTNCQTGQW